MGTGLLNARSVAVAAELARDAARLRVAVHDVAGATVIDCGVAARGGLAAGLLLARLTAGDLLDVSLAPDADGLGGPVVQVHTDDPQARFVPGAVFATDPTERGPLTLVSVRVHQGVYLLGFDGHDDRSAAEALRGTRLLVDDEDVSDGDEEAWREEDLLDFAVHLVDGTSVRAHRCAAGGKGGRMPKRWAAAAAGSGASCTFAATGGAGRWRSC